MTVRPDAQLCVQHGQRRFGAIAEQIGGSRVTAVTNDRPAAQLAIRTRRFSNASDRAGAQITQFRHITGMARAPLS
jgi:hypothetical protein